MELEPMVYKIIQDNAAADVYKLIAAAAAANSPIEAQQLGQAALNCANAYTAMHYALKGSEDGVTRGVIASGKN
jgi:hypothetical protein